MKLIQSGNSKAVNIDQVSNIGIDYKKARIIFNLQYSINIFKKYTPDYVYFELEDREELNKAFKRILGMIGEEFIISEDPKQRVISKKCISSINFIESQKRIIFNLNYNITHPNEPNKLTSDFVFWTFDSHEMFMQEKEKIKNLIALV